MAIREDRMIVAAEVAASAGLTLSRHQRWALVRRKMIQLVGGLIMEKNEDGLYVISMGKVSWWVAFVPAIIIWAMSKGILSGGDATKDISPNHFNILMVLATYQFGKKAIDVAKTFVNRNKPTPTESDESGDGPG